jgi:DNA repair exonuclease SbcCD ATPase subunit
MAELARLIERLQTGMCLHDVSEIQVLLVEAAAALKAAEAHADDILEKYEARITELEAERDDALKAVVDTAMGPISDILCDPSEELQTYIECDLERMEWKAKTEQAEADLTAARAEIERLYEHLRSIRHEYETSGQLSGAMLYRTTALLGEQGK